MKLNFFLVICIYIHAIMYIHTCIHYIYKYMCIYIYIYNNGWLVGFGALIRSKRFFVWLVIYRLRSDNIWKGLLIDIFSVFRFFLTNSLRIVPSQPFRIIPESHVSSNGIRGIKVFLSNCFKLIKADDWSV